MKKIILLFITFILVMTACGGGGGSSSGGGGGGATLLSSVGSLSSMQITVGNASQLSGSTALADLLTPSRFIRRFGELLIPSAMAQSITRCSEKTLVATANKRIWNIVGLTASESGTPCVLQIQDAGGYMVLAVQSLLDGDGKVCDLVLIRKIDGITTCINIGLPHRADVGTLNFYLDQSSGQSPGQLTVNEKYFFIGFYTNKINVKNYEGIIRIDLSGTTPIGKAVYALYGNSTSWIAGVPTIDGVTLFWSSYYALENGDFTITSFELTGAANVNPSIGNVRSYYVVVDSSIADPANAIAILYNKTVTTPTDGYQMDIDNSPVGSWYKQNYLANAAGAKIWYNNDTYSTPSVAGEHSFYFRIDPWFTGCSGSGNGNSTVLIKGVVDPVAQGVTFINLGGFPLGTGLGTGRLNNDVIPSIDGSTLFSLYIRNSSIAGNIDLIKVSRSLGANDCGSSSTVYTKAVDTSFFSNQDNLQTIAWRTSTSVYILNIQNNAGWGHSSPGCIVDIGCPMQSNTMVLNYDIATGTVTEVSLSPFIDNKYFLSDVYSSITTNKLYIKLKDNSTTPTSTIHAQLTTSGFKNAIKFSPGVSPEHMILAGGAN